MELRGSAARGKGVVATLGAVGSSIMRLWVCKQPGSYPFPSMHVCFSPQLRPHEVNPLNFAVSHLWGLHLTPFEPVCLRHCIVWHVSGCVGKGGEGGGHALQRIAGDAPPLVVNRMKPLSPTASAEEASSPSPTTARSVVEADCELSNANCC